MTEPIQVAGMKLREDKLLASSDCLTMLERRFRLQMDTITASFHTGDSMFQYHLSILEVRYLASRLEKEQIPFQIDVIPELKRWVITIPPKFTLPGRSKKIRFELTRPLPMQHKMHVVNFLVQKGIEVDLPLSGEIHFWVDGSISTPPSFFRSETWVNYNPEQNPLLMKNVIMFEFSCQNLEESWEIVSILPRFLNPTAVYYSRETPEDPNYFRRRGVYFVIPAMDLPSE